VEKVKEGKGYKWFYSERIRLLTNRGIKMTKVGSMVLIPRREIVPSFATNPTVRIEGKLEKKISLLLYSSCPAFIVLSLIHIFSYV